MEFLDEVRTHFRRFIIGRQLATLELDHYLGELYGVIKGVAEASGTRDLVKKFSQKGIEVPYSPNVKWLVHPAVNEFLEFNMAMHRPEPFHIVVHKPSAGKVDIGYSPRNVAITLVYQDAWGNNNYFLFARQHAVDSLGRPHESDRLSKEILKSVIGHKDVVAAARHAEASLGGICKSGAFGPFFLEKNDAVFVCEDTVDYHSEAPHQLANFSCGDERDMVSANMHFNGFAYALAQWRPGQVHPVSLKEPGKFRANEEVQAMLAQRKSQPKLRRAV